MSPADSRAAADRITQGAARDIERGEQVAGLIVTLVAGILGALALVHFLTPCADAAALCLAPALVTRTRPLGWLVEQWRRLQARVQAAVLRMQLRAAQARVSQAHARIDELAAQLDDLEDGLDHVQSELAAFPARMQFQRAAADAIRLQLMDAERATRAL